MGIPSSIGGASYTKPTRLVIRLLLMGCTNRPFFHISVQDKYKKLNKEVVEQIGNYDPLPNKYNEKLVAINFERLHYWLRLGVDVSDPVKRLLGLCGYFPVHPDSFKDAFLKRRFLSQELEKLRIEAAKITPRSFQKNVETGEEGVSSEKPLPDTKSDNKGDSTN